MNDGGPVHPSADPVKVGQITTKLIQAVDDDDNAAVARLVAEMMESCRPGISLRQWYAGQAPVVSPEAQAHLWKLAGACDETIPKIVAAKAYMTFRAEINWAYADAMIAFEQNEKKD